MANIAVIGAGVIGLTTAYELAGHGHRVTVFFDAPPADTVSATAGAICIPFHREALAVREREWTARGLAHYTRLGETGPAAGIRLTGGTILFRGRSADFDGWRHIPIGIEQAPIEARRFGVDDALALRVPIIQMPVYLAWLRGRCLERGVSMREARIASISDLAGGFERVIVCVGLSARELAGDSAVFAARGQLVTLENTIGFDGWVLDDDNPEGVCYVISRGGEILVGGSYEIENQDPEPDLRQAEEILRRAGRLIPELREAPVTSRPVGFRPEREPAPRVEIDQRDRRVVYNYGHGGSGVTLAWGSAAAVAELVDSGV